MNGSLNSLLNQSCQAAELAQQANPFLSLPAAPSMSCYPTQNFLGEAHPSTMTIRQSVALDIFLHMLHGLMAGRGCAVQPIEDLEEQTAKAAVRAADALIRELEK